jgi:hypothetical protein
MIVRVTLEVDEVLFDSVNHAFAADLRYLVLRVGLVLVDWCWSRLREENSGGDVAGLSTEEWKRLITRDSGGKARTNVSGLSARAVTL